MFAQGARVLGAQIVKILGTKKWKFDIKTLYKQNRA